MKKVIIVEIYTYHGKSPPKKKKQKQKKLGQQREGPRVSWSPGVRSEVYGIAGWPGARHGTSLSPIYPSVTWK